MTDKPIPDMIEVSKKYYHSPAFHAAIDAALDDADRKKFQKCMATARLYWDMEYRAALQQTLGEALYKELRRPK